VYSTGKTTYLQNGGATGGAINFHLAPTDRSSASTTSPTAARLVDADLALLIDRWPTLPDAIKAAILAMVRDTESKT
jgi:hypothetical protein